MKLKDYFKKVNARGLTAAEIVTLCYMAITTVLVFVYWDGMTDPASLLWKRAGILGGMAVLYLLFRARPCRAMWIMRSIPVMFLLTTWYPETYEFCRQWPYYDHIFADLDQMLFDYQPALVFPEKFPQVIVNELLNMGYFSYYWMMLFVIFYYTFCQFYRSEKAVFVFLSSFFLYYIIYMFLPVAGPYYYFKAIGMEAVQSAHFTDLGNYFSTHFDMLPHRVTGLFSRLVLQAQEMGERPVAAFPSSHVGMSTVAMLLAHRSGNRTLFWGLVPFYLLLCLATVYIRAHYAVDAIAGFVSAVVFFYFFRWLYATVHKALDARYDKYAI